MIALLGLSLSIYTREVITPVFSSCLGPCPQAPRGPGLTPHSLHGFVESSSDLLRFQVQAAPSAPLEQRCSGSPVGKPRPSSASRGLPPSFLPLQAPCAQATGLAILSQGPGPPLPLPGSLGQSLAGPGTAALNFLRPPGTSQRGRLAKNQFQ